MPETQAQRVKSMPALASQRTDREKKPYPNRNAKWGSDQAKIPVNATKSRPEISVLNLSKIVRPFTSLQSPRFNGPFSCRDPLKTSWRKSDVPPPRTERKTERAGSSWSGLNRELIEAALRSLSDDRIRPLLSDVLQRVKSKIKETEVNKKKRIIDVPLLHDFIRSECRSTIRLVSSTDSRQLSTESARLLPTNVSNGFVQIEAVLIHRPSSFQDWIDPHDPKNPFPISTWRSLWAFMLCRLGGSPQYGPSGLMPYQFKGGRYGLAVELQKSEFPAFSKLVLGELCHLVQLAINGGLLAYERSVLQPIAACGDISGLLLGETESEVFSSITSEPSSRANDLQHRDIFETVDELARCLDQVLDERPMGIVVAQLKKSLLTRYQKELIPERFGYRKLTDFLTSCPRVKSICKLVCPDPTTHRLVLMHRKFSTYETPGLKAATPPSPGSLSTAAGSDVGLCKTPDPMGAVPLCKTPDPMGAVPTLIPADPPIPYAKMSRAPSNLTPITFLFWASQPGPICQFSNLRRMRYSQDDDDDDVPFNAIRKVLADMELSDDQQGEPKKVDPAYWDCQIF